MVTRKECQEAYGVIGTPNDRVKVHQLFDKVQNMYQAEHKYCVQTLKKQYGILQSCNFDLQQTQCAEAGKVFNLEPGDVEYIEDIYQEAINSCASVFETQMSKLRKFRDFLKQHHEYCTKAIQCADNYRALGLLNGGSDGDIKKAYRAITWEAHPDQKKSSDCDQDVLNKAKKELIDNECSAVPNIQDFMDNIGKVNDMFPDL
jgi:DnaJ-domain-containing protein 1